MKQKFLGNFLFLLFVNVLIKPLYVLGVELRVQNVVGSADYGDYFALFNFSFIYYVLLDLGLTQYNTRVIAQDTGLLGKLLPNFLVAKTAMGFIYLTVMFASAYSLGYADYQLEWLFSLGLAFFFISMSFYFRSNIAALHFFKLDALLSILDRGLLIILLGIWLYFDTSLPEFTISHFIYAQVVAYGISAAISFAAVLKYGNFKNPNIKWSLVKNIIKESYPYSLLILLTTIYTRTDAVMLERILPETGATESGYYAASFRLLDMASMVGLLMASQLMPMFARMLKEKDIGGVRQLAMTGFRLIMFFALSLSLGIYFYRYELVELLYNAEEYPIEYVGDILGYLIFSFIAISSSYVFNTLMNANGSLRVLNTIAIIGVFINIVLNFVLIPRYGALGAVLATLVTQGGAAIGHIYFSNRIISLQLPGSLFLRIFAFVLMTDISFYLISSSSLFWMYGVVACVIAGILAALISGLLSKDLVREFQAAKHGSES